MEQSKTDIELNKVLRNQIRKIFLKELKKVLVLKEKINECLRIKDIDLAKQAKIDEIIIPIFDGANYSCWKFRLMTLLEYKECCDQAQRDMKESNKEEEWKKKDLKARNILISTISDKQLEYVRVSKTAKEMIMNLDKLYETKSTSLQIICRGRIKDVKLKDFEDVEQFFFKFEKAVNEFKSARGKIDEAEKMRYLIKALLVEYCYIGDFIDIIPEKERTVDYVK